MGRGAERWRRGRQRESQRKAGQAGSLLARFHGRDDPVDGFGIGRGGEGVTEIGVVKVLGDVGQGVEMLLELALGNQEQDHQLDRLIVERLELHAGRRAAEDADDLGDEIGDGVRNTDAEADAGAHRLFALLDDRGDVLAVFGRNSARRHQLFDEFVDRLPAIGRPHLGDDLSRGENVREVHSAKDVEGFRRSAVGDSSRNCRRKRACATFAVERFARCVLHARVMAWKTLTQSGAEAVLQFSVFVANKLGRLHDLTSLLKQNNVHILALTVLDTTDSAILRVVVDDAARARELLREQDFPFTEARILVVEVDIETRLEQALAALLEAEINIHYIYAFLALPEGKPLLALNLEDLDVAADALRRHNFRVLTQADLNR